MNPGTAAGKNEEDSKTLLTDDGRRKNESCVKYFDALWFCYSPVHQFQEVYCHGQADDCFGHWSDLYDCLKKRTKYADKVKQDPMQGKHPLWTLRSKTEAAEFWEAEFGSRSKENAEPAPKLGEQMGQKTPEQGIPPNA